MSTFSQEILAQLKKSMELSQLKSYCRNNYISNTKSFLTFIYPTVTEKDQLNLDHARDYLSHLLNSRKLKIGSVNNHRSALKYLFEVALEKEWNDRKVPFLKGYTTLPVVLSRDEVKKILDATSSILFQSIFSTIYSSGLRIDEALSLKVSDILPQRKQILIKESKNGSSRYAILSDKNHKQLQEYFKKYWIPHFGRWKQDDHLFTMDKINGKTRKISAAKVGSEFKNVLTKADVKRNATVHSLRHSFSTHLLESGTSIFTIKELLGHRSLRSTTVYLHLTNFTQMGVRSPYDE